MKAQDLMRRTAAHGREASLAGEDTPVWENRGRSPP